MLSFKQIAALLAIVGLMIVVVVLAVVLAQQSNRISSYPTHDKPCYSIWRTFMVYSAAELAGADVICGDFEPLLASTNVTDATRCWEFNAFRVANNFSTVHDWLRSEPWNGEWWWWSGENCTTVDLKQHDCETEKFYILCFG